MLPRFVLKMSFFGCFVMTWGCGPLNEQTARAAVLQGDSTVETPASPFPVAGAVDTSSLSSLTLKAGDGNFLSPERGFMKYVDLHSGTDYGYVRTAGSSVGWGVFRLDDYMQTEQLPDSFFALMKAKFVQARQAHIKLMIRFSYNYPYDSYNGSNQSDAPLNTIVRHIAQLGPILRDNQDVIVAIQAGFVGQWGEWHDSTHGLTSDPNRLPILSALAQHFPADRQILLRTPELKRTLIGGPVTSLVSNSNTLPARFGWHNDCFLASESDAGTYRDAQDKTFMAQDSNIQAMAGETCAVSQPRTDCPTATDELQLMHWSLLNRDWHPDVYTNWQQQGCFADVSANLGYRFRLENVKVSQSVAAGASVGLVANLINMGYARPINFRPTQLVLRGNNVTRTVVLAATDIRRCAPGEPLTLSGSISTEALAPGTYTLGIRVPDADPILSVFSDYAVRFDHADTWDADSSTNIISKVTVTP